MAEIDAFTSLRKKCEELELKQKSLESIINSPIDDEATARQLVSEIREEMAKLRNEVTGFRSDLKDMRDAREQQARAEAQKTLQTTPQIQLHPLRTRGLAISSSVSPRSAASSSPRLLSPSSSFSSPRQQKVIFVAGGYNQKEVLTSCEKFDGFTWTPAASMVVPRYGHVVVTLNGLLYAIGGTAPGTATDDGGIDSVEVFDPKTEAWTLLPYCMKSKRSCPSAAVINDLIYVFGGYCEGYRVVSSVECFSPVSGEWIEVSNMPLPRYGAVALTIGNDIYIIGGLPEAGSFSHSSLVSRYSPESDVWTEMNPMSQPRHFPAATLFEDKVIVSGGQHENGYHSSLESFSLETLEWSNMDFDLQTDCAAHGMVLLDNKLFIVGGGSSTVVCLDPTTGDTTNVPHMTTDRSHPGVCLLGV